MNARIAPIRSGTLVNVPRRMAWRVMIPKKISTRFIQDALVGVKCMVIRGYLASQACAAGGAGGGWWGGGCVPPRGGWALGWSCGAGLGEGKTLPVGGRGRAPPGG